MDMMQLEPPAAGATAEVHWGDALRRFQIAEYTLHLFQPDFDRALADGTDGQIALEAFYVAADEWSAAETAALNAAAPNLSALRWKLERVLADDDGTVAQWSMSAIAQILSDLRRLIPVGQEALITGSINSSADAPTLAAGASADTPDATFWQAHARWQALTKAWDAANDTSDETFDRHAAEVHQAFAEMWLQPVHTAFALSAKVVSCNFALVDLPQPAESTHNMLRLDLQRMTMRELAPDQTTARAERAWQTAIATYRQVREATLRQSEANIHPDDLELGIAPHHAALEIAFQNLRDTPAASAAALADKIEIYACEFEDCPMEKENFAELARDARALTGGA